MQANSTNEVEIKIVQMGRDTITVTVPEGSTVADVFSAADVDSDSATFYCEGSEVESHFVVDDGDILSAMSSKVDAGL